MPPKEDLQQSSNKLGAVGTTKSQKLLVGDKSPRDQGSPSGAGSSLSTSGSIKSTKKSNKSGKTPESPSLTKKKKKNKPGDNQVKSGASSNQASIASKKSKKTQPTDLKNHQSTGSFKQKLIRKLLRYKPAVRVHDVENQQGDGEALPLCNKKTLMISTIVVILLILLIVIIVIFAWPQGGGQGAGNNNNTTTSMTITTTSMTITRTTQEKCPKPQDPLDPKLVGTYCWCVADPFKKVCLDCCEAYGFKLNKDCTDNCK